MMGLKQDRQAVIRKVESSGASSVNARKTINANDNFAPEAFTSLDMSMDRELIAA